MTPEQQMVIEHACEKLQKAYGIYADQLDEARFAALFVEDAWIKVPEQPPFKGHEAIAAGIKGMRALGLVYRHLITNAVVDVIDERHAEGLCYLMAFNSAAAADAGGARPMEMATTLGEYKDTFVKTKDGWRFQSRELRRVMRRADDNIIAAAQRLATKS
jgi:ketosteroid isomerase-like protein